MIINGVVNWESCSMNYKLVNFSRILITSTDIPVRSYFIRHLVNPIKFLSCFLLNIVLF